MRGDEFRLVRVDGYREREIAAAPTLAELSKQVDEMAGRLTVTDGGDRDGDQR